MDDLRQFALEDELDDMIEHAAASIDDAVYSSDSVLPEDPQNEEEADPDDVLDGFGSLDTGIFLKHPTGITYHTVKNVLSGGTTTYGSDGSTYRTVENVLSDGTTTYGSDGRTYRTIKNVLSEGTTTYGSDGTTYRTMKKIFGNGTVTYGSDGSKFETTPDIFGGGSTTQEK